MALALQKLRGVVNRSADADIGGAAAKIAAHCRIDIAVARPLDFLEESGRAHDLPRLTVSALRHVMGDPRFLYRLSLGTSQSLDRRALAGADIGYLHRAGTHR